jgi:hypothetical protein
MADCLLVGAAFLVCRRKGLVLMFGIPAWLYFTLLGLLLVGLVAFLVIRLMKKPED